MEKIEPFKIHRLSDSKLVENLGSSRYELKRLEMTDDKDKVLWTILTFKIPPESQTNKLQFPQTHVLYMVSSYQNKEVGTYVSFVVEDELRKVNVGDIVLIETNKKHIISNPDSDKTAIITMHHPGKLKIKDKTGKDVDEVDILDQGTVDVENKNSDKVEVPHI